MSVDMSGYVEVADRIKAFREKHAEGSLQPVNPAEPYTMEYIQVGEEQKAFIVYTAAAYRTPDDPRPGIGIAWEPFPGRTPYTKDSELMNAETSAWGRAIIAALAADAKHIASADEVRNREAERAESGERPKVNPANADKPASEAQVKAVFASGRSAGFDHDKVNAAIHSRFGIDHADLLTKSQASQVIDGFKKAAKAIEKAEQDKDAEAPQTTEEMLREQSPEAEVGIAPEDY